ncbi:MAG: methyltransferase domain-containing protein [bacterium]|nr:methyltransferase domain-containing protein [bacterium]
MKEIMDAPLYNENLPRDRYTSDDYNNRARWMSYFYQMRLITETKCESALEVGTGPGWMARILKENNLAVTTVDINPALNPDYVADVNHLPFEESSFDVVCAFEVLEHMPFETLSQNLSEMARVARKRVIISLPDQRRTFINASLKLPFLPSISLFIKVPTFKKHQLGGRHYWEIGMRDYSLSRIKQEIEKTGLQIQKTFVPADSPMNHYFVMKK